MIDTFRNMIESFISQVNTNNEACKKTLSSLQQFYNKRSVEIIEEYNDMFTMMDSVKLINKLYDKSAKTVGNIKGSDNADKHEPTTDTTNKGIDSNISNSNNDSSKCEGRPASGSAPECANITKYAIESPKPIPGGDGADKLCDNQRLEKVPTRGGEQQKERFHFEGMITKEDIEKSALELAKIPKGSDFVRCTLLTFQCEKLAELKQEQYPAFIDWLNKFHD